MMLSWSTISEAEKREALALVLQSRVLLRCQQLKKMLRFVCEAAIEGRAEELSEYIIGVEALGRPSSFNPVEDSTVRTRAYELRHKLTRFYATEAPDARIRIEIEKGTYAPRFIRVPNPDERRTPPGEPAALPVQPVPPARRKWFWTGLAAVAVLCLFLSGFLLVRGVQASRPAESRPWTPEMETFWRPFLDATTPLLVTYQTRLFLIAPESQLIVRHWRTNEMAEVSTSEPLERYRKQIGAPRFLESRNYADFGAVHSVFLLTQALGPHQPRVAVKGSRDMDWSDISNHNVIFMGHADVHPRLKMVLQAGDFIESIGSIINRRPLPGEPPMYKMEVTRPGDPNGTKYALLSRFPGPQRGRYVLVLGAAHSELPWAIAEYITNPHSVRELVGHLRKQTGEIPEAFQVVLRVNLQSLVPVRVSYATHHVVRAPEFPVSDPGPEAPAGS